MQKILIRWAWLANKKSCPIAFKLTNVGLDDLNKVLKPVNWIRTPNLIHSSPIPLKTETSITVMLRKLSGYVKMFAPFEPTSMHLS
jgi:hypothetical protein